MMKRVQLRPRTKGWRMPPNTVKVTRPSMFGNPFTEAEFGSGSRERVVALYRAWMAGEPIDAADLARAKWPTGPMTPETAPAHTAAVWRAMPRLMGKNLACYCPLDAPCHADVLLSLVEGLTTTG